MADRESYELVWDLGINPLITKYQSQYTGLRVEKDAKDHIWEEYLFFNQKCKSNYMSDPNGRLDRHKVCACYIYAIVKAHVVDCDLIEDTGERYSIINELIGLKVGLSLLRAFIIENANSSTDISEAEKSKIQDKVRCGIHIPECNHGKYLLNFASELHYTAKEESYNILSLANTLFLLEITTIESEVLKKREKKKKK